MKPTLTLIVLLGCFTIKPVQTSAVEGELVLVEYHHTKEVCSADDVGLVRLTEEMIEEMMR